MVPIGQTTRKRQSGFYIVSFTYLLVYSFSVSITGIQQVGIKVDLPEEFAPTLLFSCSVFLGLRYFLDIWGEANFFNWLKVGNERVREITSGIEQCRELLTLVRSGLTPTSCNIIKNQEPMSLPADLSNFRRKLAQLLHESKFEDAYSVLREDGPWIEQSCSDCVAQLKWERLVECFGLANIVSILAFDLVLPAILLTTVVIVWACEPGWLMY